MSFDRILWQKRQKRKREEKDKEKLSARRSLTYVAYLLAFIGLLVAPPPFPNMLFREASTGKVLTGQVSLVNLPYNPVNITLDLVTDSVTVNNNITVFASLEAPANFMNDYHVTKVALSLDDSLISPIQYTGEVIAVQTECKNPAPNTNCALLFRGPRFASMDMTNLIGQVWSGQETIIYVVSGTFGVTLVFTPFNGSPLTFHSQPLFTITSEDTTIARQNEALTASLTFFILFFAALDVRPAEPKSDGTDDERPYN
ncbi:MAG TPA: hypothetical protein VJZ75_02410 [Candidatus Bathyarchaeia archaeon]|nr:hypothetical protein [Candidatus Bathyarchaeia archaeon]